MSDSNGRPGGKHTLVEEGTEFKGTLSSKCPIVVMGKVEGEVQGPIIQVTATGVVAGNVKVKELRSAGELAGEVQAETVHISGKVRDHTVIKARTLEVKLHSEKGGMEVVFGECELNIGDVPNKEAAISAASTPAPQPPVVADQPLELKDRKRGAPETWSDGKGPDDDEPAGGKRKRGGTQPPPLS